MKLTDIQLKKFMFWKLRTGTIVLGVLCLTFGVFGLFWLFFYIYGIPVEDSFIEIFPLAVGIKRSHLLTYSISSFLLVLPGGLLFLAGTSKALPNCLPIGMLLYSIFVIISTVLKIIVGATNIHNDKIAIGLLQFVIAVCFFLLFGVYFNVIVNSYRLELKNPIVTLTALPNINLMRMSIPPEPRMSTQDHYRKSDTSIYQKLYSQPEEEVKQSDTETEKLQRKLLGLHAPYAIKYDKNSKNITTFPNNNLLRTSIPSEPGTSTQVHNKKSDSSVYQKLYSQEEEVKQSDTETEDRQKKLLGLHAPYAIKNDKSQKDDV